MVVGGTIDQLYPGDAHQQGATYATIDEGPDGAPVLDFATGADEIAEWTRIVPEDYAGGGLDVVCKYSMSTATSGNIELEIQFVSKEGEDLGSLTYATLQASGAQAVPGAAETQKSVTVSFTSAQIDGIGVGDEYGVKITRNTGVASNATGDFEFRGATITETA